MADVSLVNIEYEIGFFLSQKLLIISGFEFVSAKYFLVYVWQNVGDLRSCAVPAVTIGEREYVRRPERDVFLHGCRRSTTNSDLA